MARTRWCLLCTMVFSSAMLFADDATLEDIQERIKPIGRVHVAPSPSNPASEPMPKPKAGKQEEPGQATYEQYCVVCHQDGVAGAPKFRSSDWDVRLKNYNLEGLVHHAVMGLNAMPPKGTCSSCSEEDIKQAIEYMLPKS